MNIGIIGGGPSGMFAAWAAIQSGCDVTVYDRDPDRISIGSNHGVFALWDNCDLFLSQKAEVRVGVIGAYGLSDDEIANMYALKVYGGTLRQDKTSIGHYIAQKSRTAYNHAEAYTQILDFVGKSRIKKYVYGKEDTDIYDLNHDVIILTIPADIMFPSRDLPWEVAYVQHTPAGSLSEAFMIYNVNQYIPWYRCSAMFGNFSMEYTEPTEKTNVRVKKVMPSPESPVDSDNIWFAGRYGAWDKDVLTEDVYWHVLRKISDYHRKRQAGAALSVTA